MILYLDTSALVKLFIQEDGSQQMRNAVARASLVTTHLIAYAEACSTFARVGKNRASSSFMKLKHALDEYWQDWEIIEVNDRLVRRAGELAAQHRLRGYDSVHLAAVEIIFNSTHARTEFRFGVFDIELERAAKSAGFPLL